MREGGLSERGLSEGGLSEGGSKEAYGKEELELELDSYSSQKEPCIKAFSAGHGHTLEREVRPAGSSVRIVEVRLGSDGL